MIVPEGDIINCFKDSAQSGFQKAITRVINHIMTEHDGVISAFKEYIPAKCVHSGFPQILWIELPMHDNFIDNAMRYKFNKCLQETGKLHPNVTTLALKKCGIHRIVICTSRSAIGLLQLV